MNLSDVVLKFANTVLRVELGEGYWHTYGKTYEPPEDAIMGLEFGQSVYTYDERLEQLCEERVCAVHEGVAYVANVRVNNKPQLWPVTHDLYATSRRGAIELFRDNIEHDVKYIQKLTQKLPKLQKLLELQSEDV